MKKRFIYICMFASLLTFSSCNEALDVCVPEKSAGQ